MHHILLDSFYTLLSMCFELSLKLVVDRQTDRPTDRQTDIVTYRAAIAAKNNMSLSFEVCETSLIRGRKNISKTSLNRARKGFFETSLRRVENRFPRLV